MKTKPLVLGMVVALGVLAVAACGSGEESAAARTLPNSLADTSDHTARRVIPSYGPPGAADSSRAGARARGQVLYVPVYSHIFFRDEEREFDLTATLSIRNTSTTEPIRIRKVDFFDSEGTLLRAHLDEPRLIGPLASTYVIIEEGTQSGGVGANFIVEWDGDRPAAPPLVEAIMISTANTQGLSFTSQARVLQEW